MSAAEFRALTGIKSKRRSKYNAKRVTVDGVTFDSKAEGSRYAQLKLLQRAGKIRDLRLQVKFEFELNGVKICSYLADFTYTREDGVRVVEDTKGVVTKEYAIKRKLMKAHYGIDILETGNGKVSSHSRA